MSFRAKHSEAKNLEGIKWMLPGFFASLWMTDGGLSQHCISKRFQSRNVGLLHG